MRINYCIPPENAEQIGCPYTDDEGGFSVSFVKKLIKQYGGTGFSLHCDRDGSVQERSAIVVNGNNAVRLSDRKTRSYT